MDIGKILVHLPDAHLALYWSGRLGKLQISILKKEPQIPILPHHFVYTPIVQAIRDGRLKMIDYIHKTAPFFLAMENRQQIKSPAARLFSPAFPAPAGN